MATIDEMIGGLQILKKYCDKGGQECIGGADHDILWGAMCEVSEEDAKRLDELGWHQDSEADDSWSRFC